MVPKWGVRRSYKPAGHRDGQARGTSEAPATPRQQDEHLRPVQRPLCKPEFISLMAFPCLHEKRITGSEVSLSTLLGFYVMWGWHRDAVLSHCG